MAKQKTCPHADEHDGLPSGGCGCLACGAFKCPGCQAVVEQGSEDDSGWRVGLSRLCVRCHLKIQRGNT